MILVEQHDGGGARPGADYRQRRDGDLPPRPRAPAPGRLVPGAGPGRRAGWLLQPSPAAARGLTGRGYAAPEPGWDADDADPDQAEPEPGWAAAPDRGAGSYQDEKSGGGPSGRAADPAALDGYPAPAPCPQLLPGARRVTLNRLRRGRGGLRGRRQRRSGSVAGRPGDSFAIVCSAEAKSSEVSPG